MVSTPVVTLNFKFYAIISLPKKANDYVTRCCGPWVHRIKAGVAAWEEFMKEKYCKSPLGKYRIRKESNWIRKGLGLIV